MPIRHAFHMVGNFQAIRYDFCWSARESPVASIPIGKVDLRMSRATDFAKAHATLIGPCNEARRGLTKVGMPGADAGLRAEDPTIAELLKPLGPA
jgi:hypothetical protein